MLENLKVPYPFFIDEKGLVGRQDFWKGSPYQLVGFNDIPFAGNIKLTFDKFKQNIDKAIGMYPVFRNKDGTIETHTNIIEKIKP